MTVTFSQCSLRSLQETLKRRWILYKTGTDQEVNRSVEAEELNERIEKFETVVLRILWNTFREIANKTNHLLHSKHADVSCRHGSDTACESVFTWNLRDTFCK